MRIAIVFPEASDPAHNAACKHVWNLALGLKHAGAEVIVITADSWAAERDGSIHPPGQRLLANIGCSGASLSKMPYFGMVLEIARGRAIERVLQRLHVEMGLDAVLVYHQFFALYYKAFQFCATQ